MIRLLLRCAVVGAAALAFAVPDASAQIRLKAGEVRPYFATTPRPYPVGSETRPVVWTDIVRSPGATWLRLHFKEFDLAPGDYITVQSAGDVFRYEGRGPHGSGEFWSFSTVGDTAIVRLHGGKALGQGYTITEMGHGTLVAEEPVPEVVCGTDGRKNVACYASPPPSTFNPVARLLFADGGSFFVCTGWLVAGSNTNTLMTNNHCIDSQAITDTLEARFNFQNTKCTGAQLNPASNYDGATFLTTHAGLDYTLLTLLGNPEATWGEYTATTVEPTPGSLMLFPQHPGGNPKKLGKFEDKRQMVLCDVTAVNQTFGGSTAGSQFSYGCDSSGGASGSPILNSAATRAWGLHHFGNVGGGCNNGATHMSDICANAGGLLTCSSTL